MTLTLHFTTLVLQLHTLSSSKIMSYLKILILGNSNPCGSDDEESTYSAGDPVSILESGRSLEKEMATHSSILARRFHGQRNLAGYSPWVTKNQTWLIDYLFQCLAHSAQFSSVQSLSCVWLFAIPWTAVCQVSLSITNTQSLLKRMSIDLVMPSNCLILCHPLLLLPSIFPSLKVFSNESVLHIKWPKYWSFSFSISPSNEYSGLISFRMDWLDLLAVHGILIEDV